MKIYIVFFYYNVKFKLSTIIYLIGIKPKRCAKNSSFNTEVLISNSTNSIANVGTSAIIILLNEFAILISVLLNSKQAKSDCKSVIVIFGFLFILFSGVFLINLVEGVGVVNLKSVAKLN